MSHDASTFQQQLSNLFIYLFFHLTDWNRCNFGDIIYQGDSSDQIPSSGNSEFYILCSLTFSSWFGISLQAHYNILLAHLEIFWAMSLSHGDENTNFFHHVAQHRHRCNFISSLKLEDDTTLIDQSQIQQHRFNFFSDYYRGTIPISSSPFSTPLPWFIPTLVTSEDLSYGRWDQESSFFYQIP